MKLCLLSSVLAIPFGVTTARVYCAWNIREQSILFALGEDLAESGFEPLTLASIADLS